MPRYFQELRVASRQLRKTPGFTATVVITLAIGIGATTAIFSLIEGILMRPLPFRDPERLVLLGDHIGEGAHTPVTAREIGTYSNLTSAFSSMGGYIATSFELSGGATPEQANAARFTSGVFSTLGVEPIAGRVFTQKEEDSHLPLAVISYSLWLTRYHLAPDVVGSTIRLDRNAYSIIGVMPRSFDFPLENGRLEHTQLWVPMSFTKDELSEESAGYWGYNIVARLKGGVTLTQAAQDADRVAQQIMRNLPPSQSSIHIRGDVIPLLEYDVSEVRPLLRALFLAVSIVLLIACANVAGLLMVRAYRRRTEYAVRLALGAGSTAIIRQSVLEGLIVGTTAGVLGLALATLAIQAALDLLPESMPRIESVTIDAGVAAFAIIVALATGILCSLAPALAALRANLTETLKENPRTATGSGSLSWLRSTLVVSEIAVALILLTAAGGFLRSFEKMQAVEPGFRPDHLVVGGYQLPVAQYSTNTSAQAFHHSVVSLLLSKPGVTAASISNFVPATGLTGGSAYTLEGESVASWKFRLALFTTTYGDFFPTMGIPLVEGRYFTADDRANSPLVIIVNQSMAKHCWPGQNAIGKRLHAGGPTKPLPWATVIGVVANAKTGSLDEPADDQWYTPIEQPAILGGSPAGDQLTEPVSGWISFRSALPTDQMIQTLRSAVASIDPMLALQPVQPMTDIVASTEAPRKFNTDLIVTFAISGLLLSVTGLYALVAFSVSTRTNEIAIRMALGSQRARIARLILISAMRLALLGCLLGVIGSVAVSRIVSSFLFQVSATDPAIYMVGVLIMMAVALIATGVPAIRAALANPLDALRSN